MQPGGTINIWMRRRGWCLRSGHPAMLNHIFSRVLKGQSLWNSQHLPEDGWIPTHPAISNHIVSQVLKGQPHHTKKTLWSMHCTPCGRVLYERGGYTHSTHPTMAHNVVSRLLKGQSPEPCQKHVFLIVF
jgi:hypothetical protein